MVGRSSGGNHSPWQRGQCSPQPMPDPVIRTTPPSTMSPKASAAPVHASRRSSPGFLRSVSVIAIRAFQDGDLSHYSWRGVYLAMLPERDAWGERLPRHLGLWSAVAVLIGSTIGSGIFRVPATVAERLGAPGPVLLAWVIGGAIALFGALTYAELAAALPRSGGVFAYILEAFGPLPAFLFGWSELTVIRASALGAIATIFAEYLGYFVPLSPAGVRYVAAGGIVLVRLFNYMGVRRAAAVMNLVTVAKYASLAGLVLLAF